MAIITVTGSGTTNGTSGADTIIGSAGNDNIYGGAGDDIIYGNGGNDSVRGVDGIDTLYGGEGNDFLDGGVGADLMYGGVGNDTYAVDDVNDQPIEFAGEGIDLINSMIDWTLGDNLEQVALFGSAINATGNELNNSLKGNANANTLRGLAGNDSIDGMGGGDVLIGGAGDEFLRGGEGADTFVFDRADIAAADAADRIADLDFGHGDHIELAGYGSGGATLTVASYFDLWLLADNSPDRVTVTQGTTPATANDAIVTITDGGHVQTIRLQDGSGTGASWTQYLAACPVPMPGNDAASTGENDPVTLDVLGNDHADVVTLKLTAASAPAGQGSASIVDGKLVFDPGSDFDSLAAGETATVTVDYSATSVAGKTGTGHATITVVGANDAAIIGGTDTGGVVEDGIATASGMLTVSDKDHDQSSFQPATVAGSYGSLQIGADGSWSYQLNDAAPGLATLNSGQSATDVLIVKSLDGTEHAVTITIGGNDELATTADMATTGENAVATIDVLANDSGSTALTLTAVSAPAGKGSASIVANKLVYDPGADFDYLQAGENATVNLSYTVSTAGGRTATETVAVKIVGANDAATFGGTAAGAVTEDGTLVTSGTLTVADKDHDQSSFQAGTITTAYGALTIAAGGGWTYTLNNNAAGLTTINTGQSVTDMVTVQSLDGTQKQIAITIGGNDELATTADMATTGENVVATIDVLANDSGSTALTLTAVSAPAGKGSASIVANKLVYDPGADFDYLQAGENATVNLSYTVSTAGGRTATETVAVKIVGANDAATFGGTAAGAVTEDTKLIASGTLTVADKDHDQSSFQAGTVTTGYGALSIAANGAWTYTLNNNAAALNTLNSGQSVVDTVTVKSLDGTQKQIAITVNGNNELATKADAVTIYENSSVTVDVLANDTGPLTLIAVTAPAGKGTATIASGKLFYDPGTAFDYLQAGETTTVTLGYTARNAGGATSNEIVTVTVKGVADVATFGGVATGSVTEDGVLSAAGLLTVTDKDHDQSSFQAGNVTSAYGTLSITAGGAWSYQLNNNAAGLATLNDGQSIVDTLTVKSLDGTQKQIAITINGSNEVPTHPDDYCGLGDTNDFDTNTTGTLFSKIASGDLAKANIAYGTSSCDYIDAKAGDDVIRAKGGEDTVFGGDGNDQLYGGSGLDWLDGGAGNDQLFGGSCSDIICGGIGNDLIVGGFGADLLTGGTGADTFRYIDIRDTNDLIVDFSHGEDKLDLAHVMAGASEHHFSAAINATKFSAGHDLIWYYDGCNTIVLGNTDSNPNTAELQITLLGKVMLGAVDFVL